MAAAAVPGAAQAISTVARAASAAAQAFADVLGLGNARLEQVTYSFSVIGGPDPDWHVRRFHCIEGISTPYELVVDLLTEDLTTNTDGLLGATAELLIERGDRIGRTLVGLIDRVDYIGLTRHHLAVRVHVVPAFRVLAQQVDIRIFQGQTVPEILQDVLAEALQPFEREVVPRLEGTYNKRDYCVQFRESTFDFCCRLMEEEGIAYIFEADEDNRREKMVLVDANAKYGDVELIIDEDVPIIASNEGQADRESLQHFDWVQPRTTTKVIAWGFNFKNPTGIDIGEAEAADAVNPKVREEYLFDDRRQIVDDPVDDAPAESFTGEELDQRQPMAERRLEQLVAGRKLGRGRANVTGFAPGLFFKLAEHERDDLDQARFLLTRVVHEGDAPDQDLDAGAEGHEPRYSNSFECIPEAHEFRPPKVTPKPRVLGAQTATVVGPAGEEIHTDQHGRIKVKFHWDRLQPADDTASCWVRVAQTWAGPTWGAMVIPRIGMEVIVDFLDGNPDRPIAIGCVYNGDNPPPYPLPAEKTKSTFKTNTSPGGGGSNELRFEDASGNEEIFIHAQKDFNEVVENNHTTTVHANQTNSVDGNQTQSVGGNQGETVTGEQTMTVKKNRTVTIEGSQAVTINGAQGNSGVSGSKLNITGDYKVDASNTIEIQAPTHIKITCGGSSIMITPGVITIEAGGHGKIVLDANALMQSNDVSKVLLDPNALMQSSGGSKVLLQGDALVRGNDGGKVLLDANAKMEGAEALVSSTSGGSLKLTADAELGGANTSVSGTAKVAISAPAVSSAGSGTNEITGGVVKIN